MKKSATSSKAKLAEEVAERLTKHLKRLEADPKFNKQDQYGGLLYHPHAWADRGTVAYTIRAIGYSSGSGIDVARALGWVEWLDQGNSGLLDDYEKLFPPVKTRYVSIPDDEHRHQFDGIRGRRYEKLEEAFYSFIKLLFPAVPKPVTGFQGERVYELKGWNHNASGNKKATYHIMTEAQQKGIENLFEEIRNGLDQSFNDGKLDGQDFLGQMVRGEITIADFGIKGEPAKRGWSGKLQEERD